MIKISYDHNPSMYIFNYEKKRKWSMFLRIGNYNIYYRGVWKL